MKLRSLSRSMCLALFAFLRSLASMLTGRKCRFIVECDGEFEAAIMGARDPSNHYICLAKSVAGMAPKTNADGSMGSDSGSGIVSVIVKNGVPPCSNNVRRAKSPRLSEYPLRRNASSMNGSITKSDFVNNWNLPSDVG